MNIKFLIAVSWWGCDSDAPSSAPNAPETKSCNMNDYCRSKVGPLSYCKDWLSLSSCQGGDEYTNCVFCGLDGGGDSSPPAGESATPGEPTPSPPQIVQPSVPSGCKDYPPDAVPLFLWVEGVSLHTKSEFEDFFRKLKNFIISNCVHMRVTTLVIRTPNPIYPTSSAEPVFWPPSSSPLYTQLISQLPSNGKLKILLYPYVMEDFDRTAWVNFGKSAGARVSSSYTFYDGIFAFTKGWQDAVKSSSSSVSIDGFMIDYEEIFRRIGNAYATELTSAIFTPYRSAYPSIKTGVTVGYDSAKDIKFFDPFMDYIHLQCYDFYYPYSGSDESSTDSIFEKYRDNPTGLAEIIFSKIFAPSILSNYAGKQSKIKLMWSTQTLRNKQCLYPMNNGSCGVNYEFNWSPKKFNEFMKLMMQSNSPLSPFEHGVYTYNFMRPDWVAN